jgi:nucleoside permease NupC
MFQLKNQSKDQSKFFIVLLSAILFSFALYYLFYCKILQFIIFLSVCFLLWINKNRKSNSGEKFMLQNMHLIWLQEHVLFYKQLSQNDQLVFHK